MLGVTSAPDKYQQIVRDCVEVLCRSCEHCIIHGKGLEELNRFLFPVLDRPGEVG